MGSVAIPIGNDLWAGSHISGFQIALPRFNYPVRLLCGHRDRRQIDGLRVIGQSGTGFGPLPPCTKRGENDRVIGTADKKARPPRLAVLFASGSPVGAIFRGGPTKLVLDSYDQFMAVRSRIS